MAQLVEVRFKGTRKAFFRWDGGDDDRLRLEEPVVVQAERGLDFGRISATGDAAAKKCGGACTGCSTGERVASASVGERVAVDEPPPEAAVAAALMQGDEINPFTSEFAIVPAPVEPAPAEPAEPEAPEPIAVDPAFLAGLPAIVRRASQDDVRKANDLRRAEEPDRLRIVQKVREHKLDMKVSDVEWQWDRARLTVYFTAEQRVDFRSLVKELAQAFRTRMELRQIGVRDEAARVGGLGRCGREFCCSTWLTDLSPVNLSLAKDQHLSLNPQQISGGCGRLLCCLKYEHEFYVASRKRFPKDGKSVYTLRGKEKVVAVDIFRERVFLRHDELGPRIVTLVDLHAEQAQALEMGMSAPAAGGRAEDGRANSGRSSEARGTETRGGEGRGGAGPRSERAAGSGRSERDTDGRRHGNGSRDERPTNTGDGRNSRNDAARRGGDGRAGDRSRQERPTDDARRMRERTADESREATPGRGPRGEAAERRLERGFPPRRSPTERGGGIVEDSPAAAPGDRKADDPGHDRRSDDPRRRSGERRAGEERRDRATPPTPPLPDDRAGGDRRRDERRRARDDRRAPESAARADADADAPAGNGDATDPRSDGRRRRRRRGPRRGPRPDAPPSSET